MTKHSKAFIIGSGIAGIASAIRLAVQGFEVTVFEKNAKPGGKMGLLEKGGYTFDTGPSLFTQPQFVEELFKLAGENINQYLTYKPVDIACKYFYEDGTIIDAWTDAEKFANELEKNIGEPSVNIKRYLNNAENVYNNIATLFLNHSLHKRTTFLAAPILKALSVVKPLLIFSSLNKLNSQSFHKQQTVQLFNRYATYNGSNPYEAPGMLSLISHLEHNKGVYYPAGGMINVINALYVLAEKVGVQFHFNTPVQRIILHEQTAKGIVVNNDNLFADAVVSNADTYYTYKHLLQEERSVNKIVKQERSSSALIFYWGIKKEFSQLQLHNIFFSNNYSEEFSYLFKRKQLYDDPTVYINITSKQEPAIHAPEHKENWFVMINVPSDVTKDWKTLRLTAKQSIIKKLNRLLNTSIEPLIEVEEILDPTQIEANTSSYMGAIYGTSSNTKMAAFLRHPNFSRTIKHLYFAGGTVHPGGGIPLCLQSAKITCNIIESEKKTWESH